MGDRAEVRPDCGRLKGAGQGDVGTAGRRGGLPCLTAGRQQPMHHSRQMGHGHAKGPAAGEADPGRSGFEGGLTVSCLTV